MSAYDLKPIDNCENIFGCGLFFEEIHALYKKDKNAAKQYQKWLDRQFQLLDKTPIDLLLQTKYFELLSTSDHEWKLYSLRRPEFTGNPRILFSVITDSLGQSSIMLLAFKELHKDYDRYIPVARERIKRIIKQMEEKENGH